MSSRRRDRDRRFPVDCVYCVIRCMHLSAYKHHLLTVHKLKWLPGNREPELLSRPEWLECMTHVRRSHLSGEARRRIDEGVVRIERPSRRHPTPPGAFREELLAPDQYRERSSDRPFRGEEQPRPRDLFLHSRPPPQPRAESLSSREEHEPPRSKRYAASPARPVQRCSRVRVCCAPERLAEERQPPERFSHEYFESDLPHFYSHRRMASNSPSRRSPASPASSTHTLVYDERDFDMPGPDQPVPCAQPETPQPETSQPETPQPVPRAQPEPEPMYIAVVESVSDPEDDLGPGPRANVSLPVADVIVPVASSSAATQTVCEYPRPSRSRPGRAPTVCSEDVGTNTVNDNQEWRPITDFTITDGSVSTSYPWGITPSMVCQQLARYPLATADDMMSKWEQIISRAKNPWVNNSADRQALFMLIVGCVEGRRSVTNQCDGPLQALIKKTCIDQDYLNLFHDLSTLITREARRPRLPVGVATAFGTLAAPPLVDLSRAVPMPPPPPQPVSTAASVSSVNMKSFPKASKPKSFAPREAATTSASRDATSCPSTSSASERASCQPPSASQGAPPPSASRSAPPPGYTVPVVMMEDDEYDMLLDRDD